MVQPRLPYVSVNTSHYNGVHASSSLSKPESRLKSIFCPNISKHSMIFFQWSDMTFTCLCRMEEPAGLSRVDPLCCDFTMLTPTHLIIVKRHISLCERPKIPGWSEEISEKNLLSGSASPHNTLSGFLYIWKSLHSIISADRWPLVSAWHVTPISTWRISICGGA